MFIRNRIVLIYIVFFIFFIIVFNMLFVNEEFYIGGGLMSFLICSGFFFKKFLFKVEMFLVLDEFNNYLKSFWKYYKFCCKLLDFFYFELGLWRLLCKSHFYVYKIRFKKIKNESDIINIDYYFFQNIVYSIFFKKLIINFYMFYLYDVYMFYFRNEITLFLLDNFIENQMDSGFILMHYSVISFDLYKYYGGSVFLKKCIIDNIFYILKYDFSFEIFDDLCFVYIMVVFNEMLWSVFFGDEFFKFKEALFFKPLLSKFRPFLPFMSKLDKEYYWFLDVHYNVLNNFFPFFNIEYSGENESIDLHGQSNELFGSELEKPELDDLELELDNTLKEEREKERERRLQIEREQKIQKIQKIQREKKRLELEVEELPMPPLELESESLELEVEEPQLHLMKPELELMKPELEESIKLVEVKRKCKRKRKVLGKKLRIRSKGLNNRRNKKHKITNRFLN